MKLPKGWSARTLVGLRTKLLNWFDKHQRELPWRNCADGAAESPRDAYRIWVSEVMLQQTQVATVIPYYEKFCRRFPTVHELATAELDEVLKFWAGLGYYSRARNLHRCARVVVEQHGGKFPDTEAGLRELPGIGAYTAAAIAAIAFQKRSFQSESDWFSATESANESDLQAARYRAMSRKRLMKTVRSAVQEWTRSERSFRSTTQTSSNPAME